jgi:hypothetical protein
MGPLILQPVVDCPGATIRNDALQPASDPTLTVTLQSQGGQIYLLPPFRAGSRSAFGSNLRLAARAIAVRTRPA